jgi:ATP-dependent DNA helicase RecG
MEITELIEIISRGEDTYHQFKEHFNDEKDLIHEIIALANSGGGKILYGIEDKTGVVKGLSLNDIDRINSSISSATADKVRPAVSVSTENVQHPNGLIMVITVPNGLNKPYMEKNGTFWVKSGADTRSNVSREEIQRMFQSSGLIHADETPVSGAGINDLDFLYFEKFCRDEYGEPLVREEIPLDKLLKNMNLARNGILNYAGMLLFGTKPQFKLPAFIVKAVAVNGNDFTGTEYIDSRDIGGKLADVFQQCVGFLMANTARRQNAQTVNSIGEPEIPRIVWEELVANALIHRNYFVSAPVRLLVLANRVEIISPGHLPNNLTIANIKAGNSNLRNPILASFAAKILPFRGLGSGILRTLKAYPDVDFIDDRENNLFKVIVHRK